MYGLSLLESLPVELLEEMLKQQREWLRKCDEWDNKEGILKTLILIECIKIELQVRELEEELKSIESN